SASATHAPLSGIPVVLVGYHTSCLAGVRCTGSRVIRRRVILSAPVTASGLAGRRSTTVWCDAGFEGARRTASYRQLCVQTQIAVQRRARDAQGAADVLDGVGCIRVEFARHSHFVGIASLVPAALR